MQGRSQSSPRSDLWMLGVHSFSARNGRDASRLLEAHLSKRVQVYKFSSIVFGDVAAAGRGRRVLPKVLHNHEFLEPLDIHISTHPFSTLGWLARRIIASIVVLYAFRHCTRVCEPVDDVTDS